MIPRIQPLLSLVKTDAGIVATTVAAQNVLRLVSTIILTRLLSPDAFGSVGIVMSVAFVFTMLSDMGFQAFVLRHSDGDQNRFLDAIWTIRLIRSLVLSLIVFLAASPISTALTKPELSPAILVAAALFLLDGLSSLSLITALRRGRLLRLSVLELTLVSVQIILSVALAFYIRSYWAILIAMIVSGVVRAITSYTIFDRSSHRLLWDTRVARDLWSFSRYVTGSSVITLILSQTDKVVLSRFLQLDEFGFYMLAVSLVAAPVALSTAFATRVLYPAYATAWREREPDLASVFYRKRGYFALAYSFATGSLAGGAPLLVMALYDDRYAGVILYLQVLGISSILHLTTMAGNEVLVASGHVKATFYSNIVRLIWLAVLGPASFMLYDAQGLVVVVGTIEIPALIYIFLFLNKVKLLRMKEELVNLGVGALGVSLAYICTEIVGNAIPGYT